MERPISLEQERYVLLFPSFPLPGHVAHSPLTLSLPDDAQTHELLSYVRGLLGPKIKLPSSRLSLPGSGAGRNSVA